MRPINIMKTPETLVFMPLSLSRPPHQPDKTPRTINGEIIVPIPKTKPIRAPINADLDNVDMASADSIGAQGEKPIRIPAMKDI